MRRGPLEADSAVPRRHSSFMDVLDAADGGVDFDAAPKARRDFILWLNMALVIGLGTCNTVARKIALVPMGDYTVFFSEFTSASYTLVFGSCLLWRLRRGIVTPEMVAFARSKAGLYKFMALGALDALADILGNAGIQGLPGEVTPLLSKVLIPTICAASYLILGTRYARGEILGAAVVVAGAVVALIPDLDGEAGDDDSSAIPVFNLVIYLLSIVPSAVSFVIKEKIFRDWPGLDIFVVSAFGSAWQLVFSFLTLPIDTLPAFGGDSISQLPDEISNGARCFGGVDSAGEDDCSGAPLAPLVYMGVNLLWNIALILLLKRGGATLTFVTNTISFPLSALAFLLSWPLLGASPFSIYYVFGLAVEMGGVVWYRLAGMRREAAEAASQELRQSLLGSDSINF